MCSLGAHTAVHGYRTLPRARHSWLHPLRSAAPSHHGLRAVDAKRLVVAAGATLQLLKVTERSRRDNVCKDDFCRRVRQLGCEVEVTIVKGAGLDTL